jgi:hypothetical protein
MEQLLPVSACSSVAHRIVSEYPCVEVKIEHPFKQSTRNYSLNVITNHNVVKE